MKLSEIQKYVSQFVSGHGMISLYLVLKEDFDGEKRYCKYFVKIDNKSTSDSLWKMFTEYLKERVLDDSELNTSGLEDLPGLSSSDEVSGRIYAYDYPLEDIPESLVLFRDYYARKVNRLSYDLNKEPKFDFNKHNLSNLTGFIIHLRVGEENCVLYKKAYNINILKRDKFLYVFGQDNRFKRAEGDFLKLDGKAELLKVDNEIFVLDVKTLEGQLGLSQLISKDAEKGLKHIEELGIVKNFDDLKLHSEDNLALKKKLAKISRVSPVVTKKISKDAIINFAMGKDTLKDRFKFEDGQIQLTKSSIPAFLNLMNDAYLTSELTKEFYEAHAKDRMVKAERVKK